MKPLIFAMYRSGGSYLSKILSNGGNILSEPSLPDDGFQTTETDNVRRLLHFQDAAPKFRVVKVCRFEHYLKGLQDRGLSFPEDMFPICLFRHPYQQIASQLFTFGNWDDNWSPRETFWDAIKEYRKHFELCESIRVQNPGTLYVRYEDSIGDGLFTTLKNIYGDNAVNFVEYAVEAAKLHYRLGPHADGIWKPSVYSLTNKEKAWVAERLSDVMEVLGYGI